MVWKKIESPKKSHSHSHSHGDHGHTHGVVDPSILTTKRGIQALKWSFLVLMLTAFLQLIVVLFSGSVALLADTIHNFADASTAIPLWIAFRLAHKKPSQRFTYGYGKVEDLAGIIIVGIIFFSSVVAAYESIDRFFHPQILRNFGAVIIASLIGFIGNEAIALYRIKVGKEMNSAALIADGYHARVDGLTSLAVLFGALGVRWGYPLADPIIGLLISVSIFGIVWQSAKAVFCRLLDGVEENVIGDIQHATEHVGLNLSTQDIKARWMGHMLHAELNIKTDPSLSLKEGQILIEKIEKELKKQIPHLEKLIIQFL